MWIGKQPGRKKKLAPNPDQDEALAGEMSKICDAAGFAVNGFLVSHGNFGSWLVRLSEGGKNHQLMWDGKQSKLVHNVELAGGGWEELAAVAVDKADKDSLIAGAGELFPAKEA